ncbi:MAG TPA: hypothetical protein PLJ27_25150, partial [Polyangiaceae bacterium]|nr:hypothetical protein [Polyangiaceae bacterium]
MRRFLPVLSLVIAACGGPSPQPSVPPAPMMPEKQQQPPPPLPPEPPALTIAPDIDARLAKFATVVMDFDDSTISSDDKKVLAALVDASRMMHELFMDQIDPQIPSIRSQLLSHPTALAYFDVMAGPWDTLNHDEPFVGTKARLPGGAFHPADMTKDEFEAFVKAHPDQKDDFLGYFTVIRRHDGALEALPYSKAYADKLGPAAQALRRAASLTNEPTLRAFLEKRADAFLSNEYRESDRAWMDVKGPIEVTIGPYETYADQLLGLKASFEAFVSLRDVEESRKLETIGKQMNALERNLPMTTKQRARMAERHQGSPIDVVQLLCNAGQAGVQTVAYNLPNDEHVRKEKGSKKVMMKNVLRGKFDHIVIPITERVLVADQRELLDFEAMFSYILMHEVAHGLGPGIITLADGSKAEVNKMLREQYGAIEEAKADIAGLVSAQYLIDRGLLPRAYDKPIYVAYLATVFRQVRFGVGEAHGRGAVAS